MVEAVYTWIRSLAGYFLFVTVLEQLLPGKKYGKYVRLFSGMVLILLVVQPLTDRTQMEAQIARDYEALLFQYEAGDLKEEILGVEHERLEQMIRQYEEAVEGDIRLMAEEGGVKVKDCQVSICADQKQEQFGTVTAVKLSVCTDEWRQKAQKQGTETPERKQEVSNREAGAVKGLSGGSGSSGSAAARIDPVQPVAVDISDDDTDDHRNRNAEKEMEKEMKMVTKLPDQEAASVGAGNLAAVPGLRKKIAAYYNLEEAYVEIQIVEGKR